MHSKIIFKRVVLFNWIERLINCSVCLWVCENNYFQKLWIVWWRFMEFKKKKRNLLSTLHIKGQYSNQPSNIWKIFIKTIKYFLTLLKALFIAKKKRKYIYFTPRHGFIFIKQNSVGKWKTIFRPILLRFKCISGAHISGWQTKWFREENKIKIYHVRNINFFLNIWFFHETVF